MAFELNPILSQIPGWNPTFDADLDGHVTRIQSGITNSNFRVQIGENTYVLRVPGESTGLLGINRESELACSRIAHGLGLAPEVVHFIPSHQALVTRFIRGNTLDAATASSSVNLVKIADLLRRCHSGPGFPQKFSPFETVRQYHALAVNKGVKFTANLNAKIVRALPIFAEIESALIPRFKAVPCHNDLLAGNLLDDGSRIWILDWEYAANGDPFFDLGGFSINQDLSDDACRTLLKSYFGEFRETDLARLQLMKLASDMREAFWGFLQAGISKLDFDYLEYGEKHLTRFLTCAENPRIKDWCRSVQI